MAVQARLQFTLALVRGRRLGWCSPHLQRRQSAAVMHLLGSSLQRCHHVHGLWTARALCYKQFRPRCLSRRLFKASGTTRCSSTAAQLPDSHQAPPFRSMRCQRRRPGVLAGFQRPVGAALRCSAPLRPRDWSLLHCRGRRPVDVRGRWHAHLSADWCARFLLSGFLDSAHILPPSPLISPSFKDVSPLATLCDLSSSYWRLALSDVCCVEGKGAPPSSLRVNNAPLAALALGADGQTSYVATKQGAVLCAVGEGARLPILPVCIKPFLVLECHVAA